MLEIVRAFFSPNATGIVLKPASLSAFISRISNGMAIAKIKLSRSAKSSSIWFVVKEFPDCKTGRNTVAAAHTKAIISDFKPGIFNIKKLFPGFR
jgi:hypothetical protein